MHSVRTFLTDESGPTAVEYAVMLAAILCTIILAISAVGTASGGMWGTIDSEMEAHGI